MTNRHPKARSVRERFLELLPQRRALSMKLFGYWQGLSTSRLFVLLALCEAETPSMASIRAMAQELPPDFHVPRVRSMRYYTRISQVMMRLRRQGIVRQVERDGVACFEVIDRVRRTLQDPDASDSPGSDDPEGSRVGPRANLSMTGPSRCHR